MVSIHVLISSVEPCAQRAVLTREGHEHVVAGRVPHLDLEAAAQIHATATDRVLPLIPQLSVAIAERMASGAVTKKLSIGIDKDSRFTIDFSE